MLARRLPSILPPLAPEEAIEVTRIQSIAGLRGAAGLVTRAPVPRAAPHDLARPGSSAARNPPQPGEATLAHHGVLFLDELSEFARPSLEALRQPLEDGHVTIVRGQQVMVFPTRFMLVAASNPCPCGLGGTRCQLLARPTSRATAAASPGRCWTASTSSCASSGPPRRGAAPPDRARARREVAAARASPRASARPHRLAGQPETCNAQLTSRQIREVGERHAERPAPARRALRPPLAVAPAATPASSASPARSPTSTSSDVVGPEHIYVAASLRLDDGPPLAEARMTACDDCLRRTDLIAAIAGRLAGRVQAAHRARRGCSRCRTTELLEIGAERRCGARYAAVRRARGAGARRPRPA